MPSALALQAGLWASSRAHAYNKARSMRSQRALVRPVLATARPPTGDDQKPLHEQLAVPAAAVMAAALFFAATPDEALAARSGGRVGGSSGFSQRRSAPSAPRSYSGGGPSINVYPTPPLVGGYGFGLPMFGGYGYGFSPFGFGMPIFGFGSLFNFMMLLIVVNVVWSVVRNLTNATWRDDESDDEPW